MTVSLRLAQGCGLFHDCFPEACPGLLFVFFVVSSMTVKKRHSPRVVVCFFFEVSPVTVSLTLVHGCFLLLVSHCLVH